MFLDVIVPADELGKNWEIFQIITIIFAILPWVVLIAYLLFFKKYSIYFYVDEEVVCIKKVKKNKIIEKIEYKNISEWYLDKECTVKYDFNSTVINNIKLFAKIGDSNE